MEHIKTLNTKNLQNTVKKGGCGECQTSCQSACKTSCTVGNQSCEQQIRSGYWRMYDKQRNCLFRCLSYAIGKDFRIINESDSPLSKAMALILYWISTADASIW